MAARPVSWRLVVAGLLLLAAAAISLPAGDSKERLAPSDTALHVNDDAGFSLRPPPGWTNRVFDVDGSRLAPAARPADGFAWIIVSVERKLGDDPGAALSEITRRPAAGPVDGLRWGPIQEVQLEDGTPAAVAALHQRYRGVPTAGWVLVATRPPRRVTVSAVLPPGAREAERQAVFDALRSLTLH